MRLKLSFKNSRVYRSVVLLGVCLINIIMLVSSVHAYNLTGSIGRFDPDDGLVRDLFESSYVYSLRLGIPYHATFDWTVTGLIQHLKSRVSDLESEVDLISIQLGFEKRFPDAETRAPQIEPFMGAGGSLINISEVLENERSNSQSSPSSDIAGGVYWEIGLLIPFKWLSPSWIEAKLTDQSIEKNILANVHLGGKTISLGFRKAF